MISKIQQQVDIPLPHSKGDNETARLSDEVLEVFIRTDGRIQVGWIDSRYQIVMPLKNDDEQLARERYTQLKELLVEANPAKVPIAIQAEFDAPTQYTVDILDACKELGIQKSITCFALIEGDA